MGALLMALLLVVVVEKASTSLTPTQTTKKMHREIED
jgi:hypothetical protein